MPLAWSEAKMEGNLKDLKKELWVRTESLFGTLAVLALSLLSQVSPVAAAPSDVQVVESYDPAQMQFAENLAVDYKGNIYVSLGGAIAKRTPDGQQTITKLSIPVLYKPSRWMSRGVSMLVCSRQRQNPIRRACG